MSSSAVQDPTSRPLPASQRNTLPSSEPATTYSSLLPKKCSLLDIGLNIASPNVSLEDPGGDSIFMWSIWLSFGVAMATEASLQNLSC
mmetsp:Transcript_43737/g.72453  ORF Transcript_43737/g.72453 Transcript_43737/m.72453 type:complete len:88 (-) Transcript_43737:410-673(-)